MPSKKKANMRCHISDKGEEVTEPSGLTIWSSNLQNPSILETLENINRIETISCSDTLSTLYTLDTVSQSYKRKLLECEKEDFEDRFSKIQKKHQLLRAKANFIEVEDDDDDEDNDFDDEIYEQMEWIKDESSAMTLHLWKDKDIDLSIQSINSSTPIMYIPKLNWREERRHLLRISMAKIRGVDDPETYLRRSVLINNTVKRLQKDVAIAHRSQLLPSSSLVHEDATSDNECNIENSMDGIHLYKHECFEGNSIQCKHVANDHSSSNYVNSDAETVTPYNFHMSVITPFSSDKCVNFQNEILQNSIFSKGLRDGQSDCDPSLPCRALRQVNSVVYSSQPCGLQYRNTSHEDTNGEYSKSGSSSLIDSVVYHSLIASLET